MRDRRLLDREKKSKYELEIRASNKNASIFSTVPCYILVRDVNDNRPEFLQREYKFLVAEKDSNILNALIIGNLGSSSSGGGGSSMYRSSSSPTISRPIGSVRAIDRDTNSELFYYLDSSSNADYNAYFELNTDNVINVDNNNNIMEKTNTRFNDELSSSSSSRADIDFKIYDLDDISSKVFADGAIYEVVAIKHHDGGEMTTNFSETSSKSGVAGTTEYVFSYANDQHARKEIPHKKVNKTKKEILSIKPQRLA